MIIFVNCKITDVKRPGSPNYDRFNLPPVPRFDVARYCFASFAPLAPIVSRFIFYLEMADGYAGQEAEMEAWLRSTLPEDKLSLYWHRCNNISAWRQAAEEINAIDDDMVYPVGNDDHAFIDSDIELFTQGIEAVKRDPDPYAVLMTGHYPEFMRYASRLGGHLDSSGNFVVFNDLNFDAMRVMKKDYFNWHLTAITDDSILLFRTEGWFCLGHTYPRNTIYLAGREQFRHFDGFFHVGVTPEVFPALEIPPRFFQREMHVRFGFDDIDRSAVNVNPCTERFKSVDWESGVEFKCMLEDLPVFWQPFIKEISVNPEADRVAMIVARNEQYTKMMNCSLGSYQGDFNESNLSPQSWIQNQMLKTTF